MDKEEIILSPEDRKKIQDAIEAILDCAYLGYSTDRVHESVELLRQYRLWSYED